MSRPTESKQGQKRKAEGHPSMGVLSDAARARNWSLMLPVKISTRDQVLYGHFDPTNVFTLAIRDYTLRGAPMVEHEFRLWWADDWNDEERALPGAVIFCERFDPTPKSYFDEIHGSRVPATAAESKLAEVSRSEGWWPSAIMASLKGYLGLDHTAPGIRAGAITLGTFVWLTQSDDPKTGFSTIVEGEHTLGVWDASIGEPVFDGSVVIDAIRTAPSFVLVLVKTIDACTHELFPRSESEVVKLWQSSVFQTGVLTKVLASRHK